MKELFMITLGGNAKGANIEVHDVQFAIGDNIEGTIDLVKNNWYGIMYKLHMDTYRIIKGADGYKINLTKEKVESRLNLYFIQLGDYNIVSSQETHEVVLLVGESEEDAKKRALDTITMDEIDKHVDSIVKVEDVILAEGNEKYYLSYEKTDEIFDLSPDWYGFMRLDK